MAEGWDWMRVLTEPCPHCGFDASAVAPDDLAAALREQAAAWEILLASSDDARLRVRPADGTWTALEYGCHVRDLFSVMTERVARTLVEDGPSTAGGTTTPPPSTSTTTSRTPSPLPVTSRPTPSGWPGP